MHVSLCNIDHFYGVWVPDLKAPPVCVYWRDPLHHLTQFSSDQFVRPTSCWSSSSEIRSHTLLGRTALVRLSIWNIGSISGEILSCLT